MSVEIREKDLVWDYFRASGAGGQRRNKVTTAVRLTHLPSGITVTATERRSRALNQEVARKRLAKRLEEKNRPVKPRHATRPTRASRERRLKGKKHTARVKRLRQRPQRDDFS